MTPTELYQAGQLADAIVAQTAEVKSHPADHARRLFLFELLAFSGDLDRARKQLDILQFDEPPLMLAKQNLTLALDAEQARRKLFQGTPPDHLAEPTDHMTARWAACEALRLGNPADATRALDQAQALTPTVPGHLNGTPFEQLRDADDLLAGILEVFSKGKYFWVPFEQIQTLTVAAPRFPRDLLYAPARLELRSGETGEVFLPTLYPNSYLHADEAIKLGRLTDWTAQPEGPTQGVGLKMYLVDDADSALLDWRMLELD